MMNCIQFHFHSPFLLPVHCQLKYKQQRTTTCHSFWHPTKCPKLANKHSQKMATGATMAITSPLILGVTSPGGDIRVLLPTSAVLLFAYVMANFVFPAFINKQFGFDTVDENPKPKKNTSSDDEDQEDDLDEDDDE